jgi:hypothetical protein
MLSRWSRSEESAKYGVSNVCAVAASVGRGCSNAIRGMCSGTYRPPSGASPATSAVSMGVGGIWRRVLMKFICVAPESSCFEEPVSNGSTRKRGHPKP